MSDSNSPLETAARTRHRRSRGFAVLVTALSLCGCATAPVDPAVAARGQVLAEQYCGACHAVALAGASNFPGAPAFRDIHFDRDAISYQRRLAQWHADRVRMPPAEMTSDELADIAAYISSLKQSARR
jgi:mono/diheme cytochrome c family protein